MCSLSHSDRPTNGLPLTRHVITSYFFSLFCFFLFFWTISCECISLLCALYRTFSLIRRNTLSRARFHTFKESESNTYCGNLYFHWYVRAVFAMLISVSVQLAVERQLFFSFYHLLLFPLIVTIRSSCCQNTNNTNSKVYVLSEFRETRTNRFTKFIFWRNSCTVYYFGIHRDLC